MITLTTHNDAVMLQPDSVIAVQQAWAACNWHKPAGTPDAKAVVTYLIEGHEQPTTVVVMESVREIATLMANE